MLGSKLIHVSKRAPGDCQSVQQWSLVWATSRSAITMYTGSSCWSLDFTHWSLLTKYINELGHHWFRLLACHLFSSKPLPETVHTLCQLHLYEQILVKFESIHKICHWRKYTWICRLQKWQPFCSGINVSITSCLLILSMLILCDE